MLCRSLYGFVDWNPAIHCHECNNKVEAYTASWIEISSCICPPGPHIVEAYTASWIEIPGVLVFPDTWNVEAYTASWIEMQKREERNCTGVVEAYTASWIEIYHVVHNIEYLSSKPIRLRGLKLLTWYIVGAFGSVEAYTASWIEIHLSIFYPHGCIVEAYTASWIEIKHHNCWPYCSCCRSLYGFVDWNI